MHACNCDKVIPLLSRNCVSRMSVRGLFIKIALDERDFSLLLLPVIDLYFWYLAIFTCLYKVAPPLSREREQQFKQLCYVMLLFETDYLTDLTWICSMFKILSWVCFGSGIIGRTSLLTLCGKKLSMTQPWSYEQLVSSRWVYKLPEKFCITILNKKRQ